MKRHAFDPTSFVAGLVLGAIALAYLLAEQLDRTVDGRWVLPVALIGLGVAGIAGALGGLRRNGEVGVTPPASAAPGAPTPAPTDPATAGAAGPSAPQE
jgi:heme A synthase